MRKEIGPIASPDLIQFAPGLPKTRSGKIMRRILRKIAEDDFGNLGDTSTLADPGRGRRSGRTTGRTRRVRRRNPGGLSDAAPRMLRSTTSALTRVCDALW